MITITGASDDLIEVEGDIREEFNFYDSPPLYLGCSNGVLLKIWYDDDGIWRIQHVTGDPSKVSIQQGDVVKDTNDIATVSGDIKWITIGEHRSV